MLTKLLPREAPAHGGAPALDPGRCLRGRFARTSCRRCADACPAGAVDITKGLPSVNGNACAGCRLCQASCPTGALGDPEELDRAIRELEHRPHPVLGCRMPGVEAHARLACLGLLDVEALLALTASFPGGLTLNLVHCGACNGAAMVPVLRRSLETLATLPGRPGDRLRPAESRAALGFTEGALSRRELFSIFRRRSASAAHAARARLQPTAPEPYSAKRLPAGRRALLRAFPHLPDPLRTAVEERFFPALAFSAQCRSCTACAGVCPTGAITTATCDPPRPVFEGSACTACRLCVEFCRRAAPVLATFRGTTCDAASTG
jgi:formate hydrogenlyase subunit 6/NADH:ubiquinone oxidoreductase subunit I